MIWVSGYKVDGCGPTIGKFAGAVLLIQRYGFGELRLNARLKLQHWKTLDLQLLPEMLS